MPILQPKRMKYRKVFKGRNRGKASRGNTLAFGEYGLQSLSNERVTGRQIEAARRAITGQTSRGGKVWIRIFPQVPVTKKALGLKMGGGKGSPEYYVAKVKEGTMLFELAGVPEATAREAMRLASHKLPVKTRFVKREDA